MKMKGYRTYAFNAIAIAVAVAQYYGGPLPPVDETAFSLVVMIGNMIIRKITTGPAAV